MFLISHVASLHEEGFPCLYILVFPFLLTFLRHSVAIYMCLSVAAYPASLAVYKVVPVHTLSSQISNVAHYISSCSETSLLDR